MKPDSYDEVVAERDQLRADLAALRQRHAETVEKAFRTGFVHASERLSDLTNCGVLGEDEENAAWLASEARKGVAREQE